jgi:hypothetical protein
LPFGLVLPILLEGGGGVGGGVCGSYGT